MIELVRGLQAARSDVSITVKTSAPQRLYDSLTAPIDFVSFQCDTGMVQIDSLHVDEAESIRQAAAFHTMLSERAARESSFLKRSGARLVIGDIPPLAFAAAARAGLQAIAISNFTWDWIYAGYDEPSSGPLIDTIRAAYRHATLALRLPMAGGFAGLEQITRDIPFIARHSTRDRAGVRRWLDVPADKPLVLMSFGGYGLAGFDTAALDTLQDYTIMTTDFPAQGHDIKAAPGLMYLPEARLYGAGHRYQDLVLAADVVVTKPGYGIISECIANDAAMLYTSRGRFPEYDVLIKEMPKYLRAQFIAQEDLLAGRWKPSLEKLLSSPKPAVKPATDGAQVVADTITSFL